MTTRIAKVMVLGDTREIHHHGCEAVLRQLLAGLGDVGIIPSRVVAGMDWSVDADEFLAADLVVINGEGGLHHDRPIVEGVLDLAAKRKERSLPTALVNTSWFANSPANTRRLEAFDLLAMRDPMSRQEVAEYGMNCFDAPDLAIREACAFAAADVSPGGNVIVSDSTRPEITKCLRGLARDRGWDYLPILYAPAHPRPGKKSRKIHRKIRLARMLGPLAECLMSPRYHAHLLGASDLPAYMNALTRSSGVLTGRFHTACFCIGLGVPFVAIGSNTDKILSLLLDAGLDPERRMVRADSMDAIDRIAAFKAMEMESLVNFRQTAEIRFRNLFSGIRQLLPTNP